MQPYIMYGAEASYFTGKVRAYLRKKGLPFHERFANGEHFDTVVKPHVGFSKLPTVETPDGTILQDTSEIIDWLEEHHSEPALIPTTPVQKLVAYIFEAFGDEALIPAAMHYRWTFKQENMPFVLEEFARGRDGVKAKHDPNSGGARFAKRMEGSIEALGVNAATIPAIEEAVWDFLDKFTAHLEEHPYVLGGRASLADFGLHGPLYAHMGRDPHPASEMKTRTPLVYRWTEWTHTPAFEGQPPEHADAAEDFLANDETCPTLDAMLSVLGRDFTPEVVALINSYNSWLAKATSEGETDTSTGAQVPSMPNGSAIVGFHTFQLRGTDMTRITRIDMLWKWLRALGFYLTLEGDDKARADALLKRTGLAPAFAARPDRWVARPGFFYEFADSPAA